MHREHSASLNPTCVLHAAFGNHTFHLPAYLHKREKKVALSPA